MLTKSITYTDYNGVEHTENFYFNLSKAELAELEMSVNGGFTGLLTQMINEDDNAKLMNHFKQLILMSYGKKSNDGKRFIKKNPDGTKLADEFYESPAYEELFMELVNGGAKTVSDFVLGIVPASLASQAATEHPDIANGTVTKAQLLNYGK